MSSIYYVFIVLPIIIMCALIFIFQSSVVEIEENIFFINCPYPLYEGVAQNVTISGTNVLYDIGHNLDINGNATTNDEQKVGTEFECTSTGGLLGVNTATRQYGATLFSAINYGWFGYIADSVTHFFQKAQAGSVTLWLIYDAPAQVTNLVWFTYLNLILTAFLGIGLFMIVRGS